MRPSAFGLSALAAPALACSLFAAPAASAQAVADALAPGWTALPTDTIACVRVPDARGFLASLREGTALGQRVVTEERLNGFFQLFKEQNAEEWADFTADLDEVGLTPSELGELMQEPWGAGWVLAPTDARPAPRNVILFWAELDEDRIDTLYTALDNSDDMNERATRTDLALGGADVRQYLIPETQNDEEGVSATFENATDATQFLITRLPGRVVVAMAPPESAGSVATARNAGGDLNWDTVLDVENVHGVFARYLDATANGGDDQGFAPRLSADPGVTAATHLGRNQDEPMLGEVFIDVPRLLTMGDSAIERQGDPEAARQFTAAIQAMGLKDLGAFAGSVFSANRGLQVRGFLGAPAPRAGLVGMLDGTTLPTDPPAWVSKDVNYGHLAFDLGKLWDVSLDIARQTGGPEVAQQMQMANLMAGGMLQTDIPGALRSLGTAHRFVSVTQTAPQGAAFDAPEIQPFALVWDLANAAIVQRLMALAKQQIGSQPSVTVVDEQGFTGLRTAEEGVEGGVMLGSSNLVMGFGGGLTDRVMTSLNNPPAPADTLANSAVFQSGQDVLPYREGFFFQFSDGGRDVVAGVNQLMNGLLTTGGVDPEMTQKIQALMPSDEDLIAAVGASVTQMRLEDGGIVIEAAISTPAAE